MQLMKRLIADNERFECMDCFQRGALRTDGRCVCGSSAVCSVELLREEGPIDIPLKKGGLC